jgi:hypothetical protein
MTPLTATRGHVFLLDHQFVFLDLGLLEGSFFLYFGVPWLVTPWYVQFQGVIIFFFPVILFIFCVLLLWECRASGGVLKYSGIGETCHATTNRYKHEPYRTRVPSCT